MEQIFAAAHAPYSYGIKPYKKYWKGMEEYWMVFELIGRAGETHFYLRVPSQFRNMMESAIYAAYPEAEITEAEDYLEELPKILPNEHIRSFPGLRRYCVMRIICRSARIRCSRRQWKSIVSIPSRRSWRRCQN